MMTEGQEPAKVETQVEGGKAEEKEEDKYPPTVVKIEDAGAARKKIHLEIAPERIAGKLKEAMDELQKDAVLPGFRRGRAPKRLLERLSRRTLRGPSRTSLSRRLTRRPLTIASSKPSAIRKLI